jgi:hypothetical protein
MPTKKIILTGRYATPEDIEAQIAREERSVRFGNATFETVKKDSGATFEDLLKIYGPSVKVSQIVRESMKAKVDKTQPKKKFFFRRKKNVKGSSAKEKAQAVAAETLKPYVG